MSCIKLILSKTKIKNKFSINIDVFVDDKNHDEVNVVEYIDANFKKDNNFIFKVNSEKNIKDSFLNINSWSKTNGISVFLSIHYPLGYVFKEDKEYLKPSLTYFDVFNIYPFNIYEGATGRGLFFHEQLISWRKYTIKLNEFIYSLIFLFNNISESISCNAELFVFNENLDIKNSFNKFSIENQIEEPMALALLVDICRFYHHYFGINIVECFPFSVEVKNKVNLHTSLLNSDNNKHNISKNWYKDLNNDVFGVNLNECLEYFIMEDLVLEASNE